MTENEESLTVGGVYSKFWRITLVIISAILIFAGPTYVPYAMSKIHIDATAGAGVGAVLFIIGLAFMLFLVKKKIITA